MKVSVIIPYNINRGWLDKAIESVENQSYKNYEMIIEQSEANVSTNINNAVDRATGDLIRYLCEDDMLSRDSLYHSVANFTGDFIHSNALNFFSDDHKNRTVVKPAVKEPTLKKMIRNNCIHGGTVVYHARCFENNRFDETINTCEEYDFNMMLLSQNLQLAYVDEITYLYRRHKQQKSIGNTDHEYQKQRNETRKKVKQRY